MGVIQKRRQKITTMKLLSIAFVAMACLATVSLGAPQQNRAPAADLPMLTTCHHMDYIKCAGTIAVCAAKCELSPLNYMACMTSCVVDKGKKHCIDCIKKH